MNDPSPKLGDIVRIICSGETGLVIGTAEYSTSQPQSFVRYQAADGRACQCWWDDEALEVVA